jgi:hypothetical protein
LETHFKEVEKMRISHFLVLQLIVASFLINSGTLFGKEKVEAKAIVFTEQKTENTPTIQTSSNVFDKWLEIQEERVDHNLDMFKGEVDSQFINIFLEKMPESIVPQTTFIFPRSTVFEHLSKEEIIHAANHIKKMRGYLENDITSLVDYLVFHKFTSFEISMLEQWEVNNESLSALLLKYREFLESIVHDIEYENKYSILNSIANRFFEYCFYPSTFNHFNTLIKNKENYPVARFLYEIIWYYLARGEWYVWHKNSLFNLKREHDQGKEIVYIAGGNDIFQLISSGIYNIRNIDPLYPTQKKYYSEGWDFLARSAGANHGIGDTVVFDDPLNKEKNIVMKRIKYEETGLIAAAIEIEDKVVNIPESITVWSIETKDGKKLGKYTLERRFVEQKDFRATPDKALTVSFNELYFIMTASDENWGINPHKFGKNIVLHVKQLRAPINRKVLMNIRKIQESEFPNRFGSSVVDD